MGEPGARDSRTACERVRIVARRSSGVPAACSDEKDAHKSYLHRIRCPRCTAGALEATAVREVGKMDV